MDTFILRTKVLDLGFREFSGFFYYHLGIP